MTERVRSSGRTGRGKLGGRLPDTAPPARPRVSHRLLGGKGLSLRAPGPQSPPCRGSLPHCDPDTQRPAAGGPATLSGARPFFTQSSKHSCTSGVSAAGGPPPGEAGVGGQPGPPGSLHCPWGQGVVASRSLVLPPPSHPLSTGGSPAAVGEVGDQRPPEHPVQGFTIHICILKATFLTPGEFHFPLDTKKHLRSLTSILNPKAGPGWSQPRCLKQCGETDPPATPGARGAFPTGAATPQACLLPGAPS